VVLWSAVTHEGWHLGALFFVTTWRPTYSTWRQAMGTEIGHSGAVRLGLDGRTVAIGVLAVVLAVVLGALAGTHVGAWAGVLAALAGLVAPPVLTTAVDRRKRNIALFKRQQEVLRRFALPKPTGSRERPADDKEGEE